MHVVVQVGGSTLVQRLLSDFFGRLLLLLCHPLWPRVGVFTPLLCLCSLLPGEMLVVGWNTGVFEHRPVQCTFVIVFDLNTCSFTLLASDQYLHFFVAVQWI